MLDHMLDGRFIFGISPGGLLSDAEVFGNLDADRNAMFVEAINQVLAIWAGEPPYNIKGKYWKISTERTLMPEIGQGIMPKPLQRPHPPIVVTAVAPFSKGVTEAAARGWEPISANFLMPEWVKTHWPKYVEGCERAGRPADAATGAWPRASSSPTTTPRRGLRDRAEQPLPLLLQLLFTKLKRRGRAELFKRPQHARRRGHARQGVRRLVIWGTPEKVADELLAFREETAISARSSTPARTGRTATSPGAR